VPARVFAEQQSAAFPRLYRWATPLYTARDALLQPDLDVLRMAALRISAQRHEPTADRGVTKSNRGGFQTHADLLSTRRIAEAESPETRAAWRALRARIYAHVHRYVQSQRDRTSAQRARVRLSLVASWLNVNSISAFNMPHSHPDAHVSGVFYVAAPPGAAPIVFSDPTHAQHWRRVPDEHDTPHDAKAECATTQSLGAHVLALDGNATSPAAAERLFERDGGASFGVHVAAGELLLFPSFLEHLVPPSAEAVAVAAAEASDTAHTSNGQSGGGSDGGEWARISIAFNVRISRALEARQTEQKLAGNAAEQTVTAAVGAGMQAETAAFALLGYLARARPPAAERSAADDASSLADAPLIIPREDFD
jgi:uncharacterized protein (TIGR02466 family)